MTPRLLRSPIALAAGAFMIAHAGGSAAQGGPRDSATVAERIQDESDHAAAFDRETSGRFSQLVARRDPEAVFEAYPELVAAYTRIVDALFAAWSPHANTLPAWYAGQLLAMGLGDLSDDGPWPARLDAELASGDFDRTVHAYFLIAHSRLALIENGAPTPLWRRMQAVARNDPQGRFWISLAMAESAMLPGPLYDRMHTRVEGPESLRERIGHNAEWLGPRIPRVLGIESLDPRVAHQRIRDALDLAERRVREHRVLSRGRDAGYRSAREELAELTSGSFDSRRLLALMEQDLPWMLEAFGPPDDPDAMLESIRFLCRGRGANRMVLWAAADALAQRYEAARVTSPAPPEAAPPAPDELRARILELGDAAPEHVVAILLDRSRPDAVRALLESDAIPDVVAQRPEDRDLLRTALGDAYYALGYPPDLRPAYERALAAIGPGESSHDAASRETLASLTTAFEKVQDADGFDAAFDAYRSASRDGRIPARDPDPAFVRAFVAAATGVLAREAEGGREALAGADEARRTRRDAGRQIEEAEAAIRDANREIVRANADLEAAEERQQAAVETYNAGARELNALVEHANAAGPGEAGDAVRAEARRQEGERSAALARIEQEIEAASAAGRETETQAANAGRRAQREQARARRQAERENEALETERAAEKALQRRRQRFDAVLGQLLAGLGFVGIHGNPASIGEADGRPFERAAAIAATLEPRPRPTAALRGQLERARNAEDPLVRALATLALEAPIDAPGWISHAELR